MSHYYPFMIKINIYMKFILVKSIGTLRTGNVKFL